MHKQKLFVYYVHAIYVVTSSEYHTNIHLNEPIVYSCIVCLVSDIKYLIETDKVFDRKYLIESIVLHNDM